MDLLAGFGILALFVVFLAKESGFPVPIPSDLLMIAAGVQAGTGAIGLGELTLAILVAVVVGQSLQFLVVRAAGRRIIERVGPRVGLDLARLEAIAEKLRAGGPASIFVGLNLPGARAGVIPAAGLAGFSYASFAPAAIAGTGTFHAWHVALGYLVGPAAADMLKAIGLQLVIAVGALALLGAIGWFLVHRRAGHDASGKRQWTEAACPACLASTLLERRGLWCPSASTGGEVLLRRAASGFEEKLCNAKRIAGLRIGDPADLVVERRVPCATKACDHVLFRGEVVGQARVGGSGFMRACLSPQLYAIAREHSIRCVHDHGLGVDDHFIGITSVERAARAQKVLLAESELVRDLAWSCFQAVDQFAVLLLPVPPIAFRTHRGLQ